MQITVLIKYVDSTGSYTTKNDEFDYHMNNDLGRMVLNPDVVVRSQRGHGEMFYVYSNDTKNDSGCQARRRELKTESSKRLVLQPVQRSNVFGDINDKESKSCSIKEDERMYHLLEHVGTKPNVMYQAKVRNTEEV